MGLYKLLNILGETEMYKRGKVNVFEDLQKMDWITGLMSQKFLS